MRLRSMDARTREISHAESRFGAGFVRTIVCLFCAGLFLSGPARAQSYEDEPINYLKAPVDDPVARLQKKIDRGECTPSRDDRTGYLKWVLDALDIPVSSQTLVFSKTSFQLAKISPRTPRAIYFNDSTYIGYVKGGDVIELSTVDPLQGAVFYLLSQDPGEKPVFERKTHECLQCHASPKTLDVPGHFVRSIYPSRSGLPVFNAGSFTTSHESPISERWGGWYVGGTHGRMRHLGNVFVTNKENPEKLDVDAGANVVDLCKRFQTSGYLSSHSDIVALLTLEHQTQMHNYITQANYETRRALAYQEGLNKAFGDPAGTIGESTRRRIENSSEKLVRYMLFVDEAKWTDPISGTSTFSVDFSVRGKKDPKGRSLRDFDLKTRLFRYPCSYEIYSEAFDALPSICRDHVLKRIYEILSGKDQTREFARIDQETRRAILEILRSTKSALPTYWKE
jgi:hypothetical protein